MDASGPTSRRDVLAGVGLTLALPGCAGLRGQDRTRLFRVGFRTDSDRTHEVALTITRADGAVVVDREVAVPPGDGLQAAITHDDGLPPGVDRYTVRARHGDATLERTYPRPGGRACYSVTVRLDGDGTPASVSSEAYDGDCPDV